MLLASIGALLIVMLMLAAAITAVLARQTEPFSWEGPESQVEHVKKAMHWDETGTLRFDTLPSDSREVFDALTKDMAFQILDAEGLEIHASPPGPALDALRRFPTGQVPAPSQITEGTITLNVRVTPLEQNGKKYTLRNARSERLSLGIRSHGRSIFYAAAALTGLLAILVFSAIAFWMARQLVKPLQKASEAAAAIHPDNLTQRLGLEDMPTEIAPLLAAFNSALERLEKGYRVQQDFLLAAAHELKTPLALLRAEIELGETKNKDILLLDVDLMTLQVQQLLRLAEVSEFRNFQFKPLDLDTTIEQTLAYVSRFAEGKNVHLRYTADHKPGPMAFDAAAVSTLLKNLIENAVHHSPRNGVVTIRLTPDSMAVCDEGTGVDAQDIPKLFTRFWRSEDASYQGAGLGLSICEKIATGHGWRLSYQHRSDQQGAEFNVAFHPV